MGIVLVEQIVQKLLVLSCSKPSGWKHDGLSKRKKLLLEARWLFQTINNKSVMSFPITVQIIRYTCTDIKGCGAKGIRVRMAPEKEGRASSKMF